MAKLHLITLLTDFGTVDPYVAEMKGVILGILPTATLVDITHEIAPGDVLAAAFTLRQVLPYFPTGSVHCAVVDPGVGTPRKILAARYNGQTVVFPDNGVITLVDRDLPLEQIVSVRNDRYFSRKGVSPTFHGRDIIAPVAAHVCAGVGLGQFGPPTDKFHLLDLPLPRQESSGLVGQVLHVDRFGNLISNIPADLLREKLGPAARLEVTCAGRNVGRIRAAYADASAGDALALVNSMSLLEVAVMAGRACEALAAGVGAEVRVGKL